MIGTPINLVSQNDRRLFKVKQGVIIGYKKIVSLDTMHINILFPPQAIECLINKYRNLWRREHVGNGYYNYYFYIDGVSLKIYSYHTRITNCQLQLQKKAFQSILANTSSSLSFNQHTLLNVLSLTEGSETGIDEEPIREEASTNEGISDFKKQELLARYESNENVRIISEIFRLLLEDIAVIYFIRRIDIALDYLMPYSKSILMNTTLQQKRLVRSNSYYSIGSSNNWKKKELLAHYNRSFKEKHTEYLNRVEIKYFFNKDDMMQLNQIHHQKITERLKKNKVIPYYLGNEAFSEDEQAILRRYKRTGRKEDLKDSPILRYARLKKKIDEQRDTIEIDYEQSNVELYQGFNEFIHLANMLIESSRNDNELSEEFFRERDWLSF